MAYVNFQAPKEDGKSVVGEIRSALSAADAAVQSVSRDGSTDRVCVKTSQAPVVKKVLAANGYK